MEIRQLRTFKAVCDFRSFHKAAAHLNYAQSSISAQVQALEEELEVRLFDRLGRGIRLTEPGERLVPYAEKIVALAEETRSELSGAHEIRGTLTIRIPESVGTYRLDRVIQGYADRHPGVELHFTTCAHETLQKDLRKGVVDLGFLLTESVQAADLEAEVLGFESIVPVAAPDHPLARRKGLQPEDLRGETVLLSRVDCSYRRTFERYLDEAGVVPGAVHEFHSVEVLRRCVLKGLGMTILPRVAVEEDLGGGRLQVLDWGDAVFEVALFMIRYRERWRSPALEAFAETVRKALKAGTREG